ncbi:MAG: hypothetical protein EXQ70_09830 [Solirubrobacterales bacterium]|nr:hypothetical protein [Solirubrobacterales bacterium]
MVAIALLCGAVISHDGRGGAAGGGRRLLPDPQRNDPQRRAGAVDLRTGAASRPRPWGAAWPAALVLAVLGVVLGASLWPGFPLLLGPAAVALGLDARRAGAGPPAILAVVLGTLSVPAAIAVIGPDLVGGN